MEAQFREIPIDKLVPSKLNPRKDFDKKQSAELQQSIKAEGVIEPLVVRLVTGNPRHYPEQYEIIAGERRWRAAKAAELEGVPCVVRELSDVSALEIMIIENQQRADLQPLEEAEGYRALMDAAKYDVETVAEKIGKSIGYVYARLKLADLIGDGKKLLRDGTMGAAHAILIARLTPEVQGRVLEACTEGEFWVESDGKPEKRFPTVRELESILANDFYLDLDQAPFNKKDTGLVPAAGACIACPKRSGTNQALFADIKEPHVCTDPKCFQEKIDAHLTAQLAKLRMDANGKVPVRLKSDSLWREARAVEKEGECELSVPGLAVERIYHGVKELAVGASLEVCVNKSCKKHWPAARSNGSVQSGHHDWKAEQAKRAVEEKRFQALRELAIPLIVEAAAKKKNALRFAVEASLEGDGWRLREEFKRRGWGQASEKSLKKRLETLNDAQLGAMLLVSSEIYNAGQLKKIADLVGVDIKPIEAELGAEAKVDDAKPKRSKKRPASKPKKGMTIAGRKRLGELMKKRWADRKKKSG